MKKILILFFFLLYILQGFGQKILVDGNGVKINSVYIEKQATIQSLLSILGEPDRQSNSAKIWTYDDLGMCIYFQSEKDIITEISINFTKHSYDFSPNKNFSGELSLFEVKINRETTLKELKRIKELQFDDDPGFDVFSAKSSSLYFVFEYLDGGGLNGMAVNFGSEELKKLLNLLEDIKTKNP